MRLKNNLKEQMIKRIHKEDSISIILKFGKKVQIYF